MIKPKEIKFKKPNKKINLGQLDREIQNQFNLSRMNDDNPSGDFSGLSSDENYITVIVRKDIEIDKNQIISIIEQHTAQPTEREKRKERFANASIKEKLDIIAEVIGLK